MAAWNERQEKLRHRFLEVLGVFPERGPVSYEVLDTSYPRTEIQQKYLEFLGPDLVSNYVLDDEPADYSRLRIRYPGGVEGQPVTAYLRTPRGLKGKAPAVLCLHGHVAGCFFGKEWTDVTASELARRGFVTLAPDMFPFGERRDASYDAFEWENGRGSYHFWGERTWFQTLLLRGQTLQGLHVWELQRAIDVLQSLDTVDPTRVGATGMSGGGVNTLWIAAMDGRVACAASCAGVQSYSRLAQARHRVAVWNLAPILTVGDTPDLLGLVAPRPFLGIEGVGDRDFAALYNQEHVYPLAGEAYRRAGAEDRLVQRIHDGGHDYRPEHRALIMEWLERWLKGTR
ncbi:MAG: acetylxylan esterase [Planctomycetes bacterium]|nr:acetylxylan esterase [Planctomycetota bacterium]